MVKTYEDVQQEFDAEVGAIPGLGEGESTVAGATTPPAPPAPGAGGPGDGSPGWPLEFYEMVHAAAFSALGEKWKLTSEQTRLLGSAAKTYFDSIMPALLKSPLAAYVGALGSVVITKVGLESLEKVKAKFPGSDVLSNVASIETESAPAGSPSLENQGPESPVSFIASSSPVTDL